MNRRQKALEYIQNITALILLTVALSLFKLAETITRGKVTAEFSGLDRIWKVVWG